MSWITPSRDPTYAELAARESIHGGGGISANLLQRKRTWQDDLSDAVKAVAPQVAKYLQTKKSDAIANQLMNMEQPPRAASMDQYGATYDPALAKDQGLVFNPTATKFEPDATQPFTGGADQFKVRNMYQSYLDQQQLDQTKAAQEERKGRLDEANIARINAPGDPKYNVQLPDGRIINVTGNEAAQYYRPRANQANADSIEKIDKDAQAWTGHHLHELINSKDARNNPDGSAVITLADGKTALLTSDALNSIRQRYARLQGGQTNKAVQTFKDAQQTLPSPDLPPITQADTTPAIASQADYDALPSGTVYLAPDGKKHRKP